MRARAYWNLIRQGWPISGFIHGFCTYKKGFFGCLWLCLVKKNGSRSFEESNLTLTRHHLFGKQLRRNSCYLPISRLSFPTRPQESAPKHDPNQCKRCRCCSKSPSMINLVTNSLQFPMKRLQKARTKDDEHTRVTIEQGSSHCKISTRSSKTIKISTRSSKTIVQSS